MQPDAPKPSVQLLHGDCIEVLKTLPSNSIDSVVTDPPYGIRFMGKSWDGKDIEERAEHRRSFASRAPDAGPNGGHRSLAAEAGKYDLTPAGMRAFQEFSREWAAEVYRVLKPGGHLLSFASPRTYHHMAVGIEAAGFEVRDQIMWVFGSGFPKSHNLEGTHDGWGTALKPAHEPICMARKPIAAANVASNANIYGTGALNIKASRIPTDEQLRTGAGATWSTLHQHEGRNGVTVPSPGPTNRHGRWPANLIHDGSDEVVAMFPDAPGQLAKASANASTRKTQNVYRAMARGSNGSEPRADEGTAARFFYCAKASRLDRNEGTDELPQKVGGLVSNTSGQHITRRDEGYEPRAQGNHHPTVKPTALMAYLIRLVTPVGGTTLDPFMGSGSTGKAAVLEDFGFIGIEREAEYLSIAQARVAWAEEYKASTVALRDRQLDLFQDVA